MMHDDAMRFAAGRDVRAGNPAVHNAPVPIGLVQIEETASHDGGVDAPNGWSENLTLLDSLFFFCAIPPNCFNARLPQGHELGDG